MNTTNFDTVNNIDSPRKFTGIRFFYVLIFAGIILTLGIVGLNVAPKSLFVYAADFVVAPLMTSPFVVAMLIGLSVIGVSCALLKRMRGVAYVVYCIGIVLVIFCVVYLAITYTERTAIESPMWICGPEIKPKSPDIVPLAIFTMLWLGFVCFTAKSKIVQQALRRRDERRDHN